MTQFADVIVFNNQGQILFLRRSMFSSFEPNKLGFPGGHVDRGEKPIQAAYRELTEETGLQAFHLTPIIKRTIDDKEIYYFIAILSNSCEEISSIILDEGEHKQYEFRSLHDIEFSSDEDYILDLKDYFLTEIVCKL